MARLKRERRKQPSDWVVVHLEIPTWAAIGAVISAAVLIILTLGVVHID